MILVMLAFDQTQREAIARLTPTEQARIAELMADGTITARYIAADFTRVWLVFAGHDVAAVQTVLAGLPLAPYIAQHEITPLVTLP